MAKSPSFEAYIPDHCHECFFTYVNSAIENGAVCIPGCRRNYSDTKRLIALDVTSVTAGALYGLGIVFHVILEAKVRIVPTDNANSQKISTISLRLQCEMDLGNGIESLDIQNIAILPSFNIVYSELLSDTLIPIIRKADLERTAERFLRRYYSEALERPMPIDPCVVCARMGLTVIERRLSPSHSVFGQIIFFGTDTSEAGTVYIDPLANYTNRAGNVATSIIHECAHWDFHRKTFALNRLYHTGTTEMLCASDNDDAGALENSVSIMEWQANALAPRIQMPLRMFRQQADMTIAKYRQNTDTADLLDVIEPVIDDLASFFHVSRLAAKIRMIEAGYEEAIGAYIYIDGRYVAPHFVDRKLAEAGQTYSIGTRDAVTLMLSDSEFDTNAMLSAYQYVDSHFVRNSPLYLDKDNSGRIVLTPYALRHMEECCLAFRINTGAVDSPLDADSQCGYYLYSARKPKKDKAQAYAITFVRQDNNNGSSNVAPTYSTLNDEDKDNIYTGYLDDLTQLRKLPNDFFDALNMIVKWKKLSIGEIANITGIDKSNLSRTFAGRLVPSPLTLTKVLLAIKSPSIVNDYLIRLAPNQFDMRNKKHQLYYFALHFMVNDDYDAVIYFIDK